MGKRRWVAANDIIKGFARSGRRKSAEAAARHTTPEKIAGEKTQKAQASEEKWTVVLLLDDEMRSRKKDETDAEGRKYVDIYGTPPKGRGRAGRRRWRKSDKKSYSADEFVPFNFDPTVTSP